MGEDDSLFPAAAAASIVAKVERDREVETIEREAGVPVGSGYPSDPVTIGYLEEYLRVHRDLPPHTRRSWETARRMLDAIRYERPSLEDFTDRGT